MELDPVQLLACGTSALADGGARHLAGLAASWPGAVLAGPVVTALVLSGDNLAVQVAVAEAEPGDVVVVAVTPGSQVSGLWGEVLSIAAMERGIVGAVIDGPIRDVEPTRALGFAVFATGTCPVGPTKTGGAVGIAIEVGGVPVSPGDWIVADGDGAVLLAFDAGAIVERAQAKLDKEGAIIEGLRAGLTTLELLGLDASTVRRS